MKEFFLKEKILIKIILIIHLINNSISETVNLSSGISICPLGQIFSEGSETSCFSSSSPKVKCCILKKFRKDMANLATNVCWGFNAENLQDIYNYEGYNYKVFCEDNFNKQPLIENFSIEVDQSHLKFCGVDRPEILSDCTSASDDSGSCCMYTYNSIKQCTKLAKRLNGRMNYGGLIIFCTGFFNNFYVFAHLIFFVLFILI